MVWLLVRRRGGGSHNRWLVGEDRALSASRVGNNLGAAVGKRRQAESGRLNRAEFQEEIMKTLTRVSTVYPAVFKGNAITPRYGRSFAPVIEGGKMPQPEWMFWEHYNDRAARKGDWKIIGKMGSEQWELYSLASDGTEEKNLAAEEMEMVRELAAAWQKWAATHCVLPRFLGTTDKKTPKSIE
jgi:arylsulfatase A-like enzyme